MHFIPLERHGNIVSISMPSLTRVKELQTTIEEEDDEEVLKRQMIEQHRNFIDELKSSSFQHIISPHDMWSSSSSRYTKSPEEEEEEMTGRIVDNENAPISSHSSSFTIEWIESENQLSLTRLEYTQMKCELFEGDYYTFLMTHNVSSKTDSYVGCTKNPLKEIYLHNAKKTGDRTTAEAAPYWKPDIIMGPFFCRIESIECGLALVNHSRGKKQKRLKAKELGQAYNVNVYDREERLNCSFEEYLNREVGGFYLDIYNRLVK
jgi:hypothetical protein